MKFYRTAFFLIALIQAQASFAQTDIDAIMMEKHALCVSPMYGYSSWKNYWEGTLKRNNLNLGTVSTQMFGVMGTYGITRNINALFGIPYVTTKPSAGTLHGNKGIQDLSLFLKWRFFQKKMGYGRLSLFGIGGVSFPASNYVVDYLPLSIGLHSKTASARIMGDYERNNLFVTGSATYTYRNNITIDRDSYYGTQLILSDEVRMYDAMNYNIRAGYRSQRLIAEIVFNNWRTLGGYDITRNNMPFPNNKMKATTIGVNFKYVLPPLPQLSIVVGGNTTVKGMNMGQSTTVDASIFYVFDLSHQKKSTAHSSKTK
jgi:hypothetical protein